MTAIEQSPDQLSPWQIQAAGVPEEFDLFLGGGRGGGKTHLLMTLLLRHCEQFGKYARCLIVRKSFPGLMDIEAALRTYLFEVYGDSYRFEGQKHRFTLPSGGTIQLDQLESESDFQKYQGKSFTYICVDEAGQYASPALPDRLRSSLRAPKGVPTRFILLANPGGAGHHWLVKRHALKASWTPYDDPATGSKFVSVASTYRDNAFIDCDRYEKNLLASCSTDPELGRSWLNGDWSIIRGAYFAHVLDESRNMIEPWSCLPPRSAHKNNPQSLYKHNHAMVESWRFFLSHDYGVSAPSVTLLCARSGGARHEGRYYPRGSIILVDEYVSCHNDDLTKGLGMTVPELSSRIKGMCGDWNVRPSGVADDAIFANHGSQAGTIADEFRKAGVYFSKARKGGRVAGWERMRRMLQDAGSGDPDKPGLYISRACRYWWSTVPTLPRDPRKPDDVDTTAADHAADATSYALGDYVTPIFYTGIRCAM